MLDSISEPTQCFKLGYQHWLFKTKPLLITRAYLAIKEILKHQTGFCWWAFSYNHNRRAKTFYKLQEIKTLCKKGRKTTGLMFDYMQNLPLPFLPVQQMFYFCKLWMYVFCIHYNMSDNPSVFYTYHKGVENKGFNEVCSFISYYINTLLLESVRKLHVFSDDCGSQNRNHTLTRLFSGLIVTEKCNNIFQYFQFGIIDFCLTIGTLRV